MDVARIVDSAVALGLAEWSEDLKTFRMLAPVVADPWALRRALVAELAAAPGAWVSTVALASRQPPWGVEAVRRVLRAPYLDWIEFDEAADMFLLVEEGVEQETAVTPAEEAVWKVLILRVWRWVELAWLAEYLAPWPTPRLIEEAVVGWVANGAAELGASPTGAITARLLTADAIVERALHPRVTQ